MGVSRTRHSALDLPIHLNLIIDHGTGCRASSAPSAFTSPEIPMRETLTSCETKIGSSNGNCPIWKLTSLVYRGSLQGYLSSITALLTYLISYVQSPTTVVRCRGTVTRREPRDRVRHSGRAAIPGIPSCAPQRCFYQTMTLALCDGMLSDMAGSNPNRSSSHPPKTLSVVGAMRGRLFFLCCQRSRSFNLIPPFSNPPLGPI